MISLDCDMRGVVNLCNFLSALLYITTGKHALVFLDPYLAEIACCSFYHVFRPIFLIYSHIGRLLQSDLIYYEFKILCSDLSQGSTTC